jgi:hypothetical protein
MVSPSELRSVSFGSLLGAYTVLTTRRRVREGQRVITTETKRVIDISQYQSSVRRRFSARTVTECWYLFVYTSTVSRKSEKMAFLDD